MPHAWNKCIQMWAIMVSLSRTHGVQKIKASSPASSGISPTPVRGEIDNYDCHPSTPSQKHPPLPSILAQNMFFVMFSLFVFFYWINKYEIWSQKLSLFWVNSPCMSYYFQIASSYRFVVCVIIDISIRTAWLECANKYSRGFWKS